jgi:sugar phosphate isomerase/epimerase
VIGVSPAYYISRFTDEFTPSDVAQALQDISEMGYGGFQLEVFHRRHLELWLKGGGRTVRQRAHDLGLAPTQFVAHFMIPAFSAPDALRTDPGTVEMQAVLEIVDHFKDCRMITLPLGKFEAPAGISAEGYRTLFMRAVEKIGRLLEMVEAAGLRLALEIMPSAIIGGSDGFLRVCDLLGTGSLGFNFDTGHAWAAKENLNLIPAKLGRHILGTHLCDNFGYENLSLRPGAGSIDWPGIIGSLTVADYRGSFDVEIICPPEAVRQEYREGRVFIETILNRIKAGSENSDLSG